MGCFICCFVHLIFLVSPLCYGNNTKSLILSIVYLVYKDTLRLAGCLLPGVFIFEWIRGVIDLVIDSHCLKVGTSML